MIVQQRHRLIEQLMFEGEASFGVLAAQFDQHLLFAFVTHIVVHVGSHGLLAQRPVHTNRSTRSG
jgi:DNA polymerase III delta subunit